MTKKFLLVLLLLNSVLAFTQNNFEKGYFIDKSGKKIDCLVKDFEWEFSPNQFVIKDN
jgi:glutathionylspermidine synthase